VWTKSSTGTITGLYSLGSATKLRGVSEAQPTNIWTIYYSSPDIIRQIKSRRMRWAGSVARIGEWGKSVLGFVGKALRKESTWKTEA
jgi:hypothetical protein